MASADYFLKIGDIKGESKDRAHPQSIEVLSWSWGASQAQQPPNGSTGSGKVSLASFNVMKLIDKSTPILMQAASSGIKFPKVELTVRTAKGRATDKPFSYMKVTFTDCLVSGVSAQTAGARLPTEEISLNFIKVHFAVQQFSSKGTGVGAVVEGDFIEPSDGTP